MTAHIVDAHRHPRVRRRYLREQGVWRGMNVRCFDVRCKAFEHYGGRGITVCDRWRHDFAAFLADMGPRPSREHSIDRIDNDGNYEPGNCRWATKAQQSRNTRATRLISFRGESMVLGDWASRIDVPAGKLGAHLRAGTFDAFVGAALDESVTFAAHGVPLWETVDGQTFIYL